MSVVAAKNVYKFFGCRLYCLPAVYSVWRLAETCDPVTSRPGGPYSVRGVMGPELYKPVAALSRLPMHLWRRSKEWNVN